MDDFSVGEKVRRIRELRQMTGQELSQLSGVPQSNISDIERSKVDPKISTVEKLAKALNVSPVYFFRISRQDCV